jgi:hypothetical protein
MSNKIDPDSIDLGKEQPNTYSAKYLPVNPADLPPSCALPPGTSLDLTIPPEITLNQACVFQFPDVVPIPPTYNPPNLKFLACETLSADTNITFGHAAQGSSLVLTPVGPQVTEDGGPGNCGLQLTGNIDVLACETFSANSQIYFSGAVDKLNSRINVTPASAPDCGVALTGLIKVDACEDFKVTTNIAYLRAAKKSQINATATTIPKCGLDISGIIDVEACEKATVVADVGITGPAVKKNNWSITPATFPDCGFNLKGDVKIEACTDFKSTGTIRIGGNGVTVRSPITLTATGQPNCGLNITGDVDLKMCSGMTTAGAFNISGKGVKSNSLALKARGYPDCGIDIAGALVFEACDNITTTSNVTFSSSGRSSLSLSSSSNCGLQLTGNIAACTSINVFSGAAVTSNIIVETPKEKVNTGKITLGVEAIQNGNCGVMLIPKIKVDAITLKSILTSVDNNSSVDSIAGNLYTGEDKLRLKSDEFGKVSLDGKLPAPVFGCEMEDDDYAFSKIELATLNVDSIDTSSCCESNNSIKLCAGRIDFSDESGNSMSLTESSIDFYNQSGSYTTIEPGVALFTDSGGNCNITGGSINLTNGSGSMSFYPPEDGTPYWMSLTTCDGKNPIQIKVWGYIVK